MSELTNSVGYYIAAEEQGVLLGYAGMQVVVGEAYITNIAVDPAYRRMGIGESLLKALIEHGVDRDVDFLTLEVRRSNTGAQELYRKLGFAEEGIRKGYYEKPKEDAILMTLKLK